MHREIALTMLCAALVLGAATLVRAGSEREVGPRGYPVQTWQDIERTREDIARKVGALEHPTSARTSLGSVEPRHRVRGSQR
jgi:hypothetical protein